MPKHKISQTLLSSRLKEMQRFRLIKKKRIGSKTAYVISSGGKKLKKLLFNVKAWAIESKDNIPLECTNSRCIFWVVFG